MAKWGFLKNIVNIDRFFAGGGAGGDAKEEKKDEEKKDEKKEDEKKLVQADSPDKLEPKEEARENVDKVTSEELSENA